MSNDHPPLEAGSDERPGCSRPAAGGGGSHGRPEAAACGGAINGAAFTSSVMPAGGGLLALSVSKAMMSASGASVGDEVELEIQRA